MKQEEMTMTPQRKKHEGSLKRRKIIGNTAIYIVLVIMSFVWLIPFLLILFHHQSCLDQDNTSRY